MISKKLLCSCYSAYVKQESVLSSPTVSTSAYPQKQETRGARVSQRDSEVFANVKKM